MYLFLPNMRKKKGVGCWEEKTPPGLLFIAAITVLYLINVFKNHCCKNWR